MQIEGYFLYRLVRELDKELRGGRIDKIAQSSKYDFVFSIRKPHKNLLLYASMHPTFPTVHLIEKNLKSLDVPPTFCMVLRKHVEGGRIAGIQQSGLDRILIMDVDFLSSRDKIETKCLIFELTGKNSNLILTLEKKIIDAHRRINAKMSHLRKILPNEEYLLPKSEKVNLLNTDFSTILKLLKEKSAKTLEKASMEIFEGFGVQSTREFTFLTKIPPEKVIKDFTEDDFGAVKNALSIMCQKSTEEAIPHIYLDEEKKVIGFAPFQLDFLEVATNKKMSVKTFPSLFSFFASVNSYQSEYIPSDKKIFQKIINLESTKLDKKIEVLQKELLETDLAETYKNFADHLMTYQHQIADHQKEVTLPNLYSTTGEELLIPLDPKYTLKENINLYYKCYNKLKRAKEQIVLQISKAKKEIAYLKTLEQSLDTSGTATDLEDIRLELISNNYLKGKKKKAYKLTKSMPFSYWTKNKINILVGKNNYQNDRLTFTIAQKYDLWLHTKDIPGSHVILRLHEIIKESGEKDFLLRDFAEEIETAALIAAYFSKAKNSTNVPVDYTFSQYVKKPAGGKAGFVIFTRQKTLYVTPKIEMIKERLMVSKDSTIFEN